MAVTRTDSGALSLLTMHKPSPAIHLASWRLCCVRLLMFALLWGWLAAPLIQVQGTPADGTWVQVCTSLGTRLVQLDQGDSASKDGKAAVSTSPSTDCPYCHMHGSLALIPSNTLPLEFPDQAQVIPTVPVAQAVPRAPPWHPAQPRAPPTTISA